MDTKAKKKISKLMSLLLRHQPEAAGLQLDDSGWVDVDDLIAGMARMRRTVTREQLNCVVIENDKQRFQFDESGQRIRASQGHSVDVDLGYEPSVPPETLFHGTPQQFVESIRRSGLNKQKRHHVHLHQNLTIATDVGQRRGIPVILTIRARDMHEAGHEFFVTPNQVWLTDAVPIKYIEFPDSD